MLEIQNGGSNMVAKNLNFLKFAFENWYRGGLGVVDHESELRIWEW